MNKNKYFKLLLIILFTLFVHCITACSSDTIKINGEFETSIEVNTEFVDLGVSCSEKYNVITEGVVNINKTGRYEIKYKVYSEDGELVKELSRYITVVDTIPPNFDEVIKNYYAGFTYNIDDFITYSDNYNTKEKIETDFTTKTFTRPGEHLIKIKLKDSSNNETEFSKYINVNFDIDKIIKNVYKNTSGKITTTTSEGLGVYTHVKIDNKTSFAYWDNGKFHFGKQVDTSLGTYASISISTSYAELNHATIDFNVSKNSTYSSGWTYLDTTQKYTNLQIKDFESIINHLSLNETEMLNELNDNVLSVLNDFQNYMNNVLNLDIN